MALKVAHDTYIVFHTSSIRHLYNINNKIMNQTKIKTLATAVIMSVAMTATAQTGEAVQTDNFTEKSNSKSFKSYMMNKLYAGWTVGGWTGKDFKDGSFSSDGAEGNVKNKNLSSFHITGVTDFYFNKFLYYGVGLGYNRTGYKQEQRISSGRYWNDDGANYEGETNTTVTLHKIELPTHIGGYYYITPKIKIFAEAGPYISYTISGKAKRSGYLTTHEDIHSGEKEYINEKDHLGEGCLNGYRRFGYGLSAAAGVSCYGLMFQFTYQRGLSKTIKDSKQYEQNLMFSIGFDIKDKNNK